MSDLLEIQLDNFLTLTKAMFCEKKIWKPFDLSCLKANVEYCVNCKFNWNFNLLWSPGTLWSKNSALLHRMRKLDEYIKRGTDMETRYVIEIIGYPWDQDTISPGVFLENLAFSMGISNFSQSQVTGLRIMAGMKYSDARVIVEFPSSKIKRLWLKGYKKKLYEVSWGRKFAQAVY